MISIDKYFEVHSEWILFIVNEAICYWFEAFGLSIFQTLMFYVSCKMKNLKRKEQSCFKPFIPLSGTLRHFKFGW